MYSRMTRTLMFQGTGSDVGKSLIVAGLARAFTKRGLRVRPFKPQNMANNAAVAADGGEIGRAQALQARAAGVPVVRIGDIDRGGVIASLVGTKAVIDPEDAAMIRGFIVNKFRGDPSLFMAGREAVTAATGWPALGLVPYFPEARNLPAEDALALDRPATRRPDARIRIAVPILPQIANFDDLDPLE